VLAALGLWFPLAGCGAGLGELCTVDQDCRSGLRCSASEGRRGVCVYTSAPASDLGADAARPDAARREAAPAEGSPADAPRLEGPPADVLRLEGPPADAPRLEGPPSDGPAGDRAQDLPLPDQFPPSPDS